MADITKIWHHHLNQADLRGKLEQIAGEVSEKLGIQCDFKDNAVHLSGPSIKKGRVTWTSEKVSIELSLGFMGKMFKPKIEKEIETQLEAILGS